jgi:hypothetical protein
MSKTLLTFAWGCLTLVGTSLFYWAGQLSVRYNGWTTSFRERHRHINPPPTAQMRESNTKTMTWLFRALGTAAVLRSVVGVIDLWISK